MGKGSRVWRRNIRISLNGFDQCAKVLIGFFTQPKEDVGLVAGAFAPFAGEQVFFCGIFEKK